MTKLDQTASAPAKCETGEHAIHFKATCLSCGDLVVPDELSKLNPRILIGSDTALSARGHRPFRADK